MNKSLKIIDTLNHFVTAPLSKGANVGAASSCPQGKSICAIHRGEKGITLIALIVTIIVLLILAMTSVSLVLRNNLIEKAQTARNEYQTAAQAESDQLDELENAIDNIIPPPPPPPPPTSEAQWGEFTVQEVTCLLYIGSETNLTLTDEVKVQNIEFNEQYTEYTKVGEIRDAHLSDYQIIYVSFFGPNETIKTLDVNGFSDRIESLGGLAGLTTIKGLDGKESIQEYYFEGCIKLDNIKIPDTVTRIHSTAFEGCTALKNITVEKTLADAEATLGTDWIPSGATVTYTDQSKTY